MSAVPEFGHALLGALGAPKGKISAYVEVPLKDPSGKVHIPDGAIVVERGRTRWRCLVEVKTGDAVLRGDQVTRYVDMARTHAFDCVVTLSNAITSSIDELPYDIDGRKLRSMRVRHLSWWRVITEAVVQHRYRGIGDPDQAWILGELIAYLDHEASGASGFTDMGASWVKARDAAHNGTLRGSDPEARETCERFAQFTEYLALGLAQDLGADVSVAKPRSSTPDQRTTAAIRTLTDSGVLTGSIRVPDAIGHLDLTADLRSRRVYTSVSVRAPEEGRPATRVGWLLRQLSDAPAGLRIEVSFQGTRETTSLLLGQARDGVDRLLSSADPKRVPRAFVIELGRPLGTKRGRGKGTFVTDTRRQLSDFYREVVQGLAAWQPKAPRLRTDESDRSEIRHPPPEPIQPEALPDQVATRTPPSFLDYDRRDVTEAEEPDV